MTLRTCLRKQAGLA